MLSRLPAPQGLQAGHQTLNDSWVPRVQQACHPARLQLASMEPTNTKGCCRQAMKRQSAQSAAGLADMAAGDFSAGASSYSSGFAGAPGPADAYYVLHFRVQSVLEGKVGGRQAWAFSRMGLLRCTGWGLTSGASLKSPVAPHQGKQQPCKQDETAMHPNACQSSGLQPLCTAGSKHGGGACHLQTGPAKRSTQT